MVSEATNQQFVDRRSEHLCADHSTRLGLLEQSSENVQKTMEGVSTKLDLILAQITRVAILEERHATQAVDVTKAHEKISKLDKELTDLAKETRAFINYSQGRDKVLWSIGAGVLLLAVKVLFFAASHGMPTP